MNGPKVLRVEQPYDPGAARREAYERRQHERSVTGIRRYGNGWQAIVNGRLVEEYHGPGCKAAAIRQAGTNVVID